MVAGPIPAPRIPSPLVASRPFFALGTVVLLATLFGPIPDRHGLVLGALCAAAGAARWSWETAVLRGLKRTANDALVQGARPERSPLLSWRAAELTSASYRRSLARSLRGVVRDATARISISASPVNRQAARGEVEAIERLATRLGDLDHPAEPRGILFVEDLLTDGFGPLYARERASDLRSALDRCLAALDPESLQR
jgi:hypothetical protein